MIIKLPKPAMEELNPYLGTGHDPYAGTELLHWYSPAQMRQAILDALEEAAKVCDSEAARALRQWRTGHRDNQPFWNGGEQIASGCALSIRAIKVRRGKI